LDKDSDDWGLQSVGLVLLLVAPAAAVYAAGHDVVAHYAVLGAVLAFQLGIYARRLAPFALLIPFVYAAASVTANFTDGVAALVVAVAAATGAASSLGYHRALLAVLAAVLIGSFEPASADEAARRSLAMFAGCAYGVLIVHTVARGVTVRSVAVDSGTALGYSILLAALVTAAWFAARTADVDALWWLPLAVAALGEPWLDGTPGRAVTRLALALVATLIALTLLDPIMEPVLRAACAGVLLLALVTVGRERPWLHGFLFTPVLVLLAADDHNHHAGSYLDGALVAFGTVAAITLIGKGMLWTLRRDAGHAVAGVK
jgi:hypothetical protein